MRRRNFLKASLAITAATMADKTTFGISPWEHRRNYKFDQKISREVLCNYLSRAICMEGLLNGRGDLDDNIRMLKYIGAKQIARSICLWGGEAKLLDNFERAKQQVPQGARRRSRDGSGSLHL